MRVRLPGPADVVVDGAFRPVSGLRRKAVLAVLALQHGDIVSSDRLADVIWAGEPLACGLSRPLSGRLVRTRSRSGGFPALGESAWTGC